jgi:MFS family permease
MQIEKDAMTFRIAAIASLVLGVLAFFLPKTPPQPSSDQKVSFGTEIAGIFKNNRNFTVLITLSSLLCIFLMFYYSFANPFLNDIGMKNAAGKMTLGQLSELLIMLAMPYFFVHLGTKKMLLIGVGAWALRYLLFASGNTNELIWMLYLGIILHGLCYNFFFVTGQIYVDKIVPARLKSTGQGLYTFVTYGIGYYLSTWIAGIVVHHFRDGSSYHWKPIWIFPGIMSGIILLLFLFLFKSRKALPKNNH